MIKVVVGDGFEPPNSERADLQSAAFSHFATPPAGAGSRTWTRNLLITSQLLYQLSYSGSYLIMVEDDGLEPPTLCL